MNGTKAKMMCVHAVNLIPRISRPVRLAFIAIDKLEPNIRDIVMMISKLMIAVLNVDRLSKDGLNAMITKQPRMNAASVVAVIIGSKIHSQKTSMIGTTEIFMLKKSLLALM